MPRLSKDSAPNVRTLGPAVDQGGDLDDITVNFVTIKAEPLAGPAAARAARGQLPVPALGYLFAGKITVSYADREETYQAGDAFLHDPRARPRGRGGHGVHPVQPEGAARRDDGGDRWPTRSGR